MLHVGYTGTHLKAKARHSVKPQMDTSTRVRITRKTRNEFRRFVAEVVLVAIAAVCGATLLCVFALAAGGDTISSDATEAATTASIDEAAPRNLNVIVPNDVIDLTEPAVDEEIVDPAPDPITTVRLGVTVDSYDATVNYQSLIDQTYDMIDDDQSNEEMILSLCEVYEAQRNYKIEDTGSSQSETHYFDNDLSYEEIDRMINPPWYDYTEDDVEALAALVYAEGGSDWVSDEHQRDIASVVVNRVISPVWNGDTIREVINSPGQYPATCNNTVYDERAYENALYILQNGPTCDAVYQANFKQGTETVAVYDYPGHSVTYICK